MRVGYGTNDTDEGMVEMINWEMRELFDVERDLQNLAKDLSESLQGRMDKCTSTLQATLACIDLDVIFNLLVGSRNPNGYPSLTHEDELVLHGKVEFSKFFSYVCSLPHVIELVQNHFTKLNLRGVYSDEVLSKLKTTLKTVLWTPSFIDVLRQWLVVIDVTGNEVLPFVTLLF